jgi:hypothetical protein
MVFKDFRQSAMPLAQEGQAGQEVRAMARCLIAGIHASRDLEQDGGPCCCMHCEGFCSCESNIGPDNSRNIETDDEGSYEEYLHGKCACVDYLSKWDAN